MVKRGAVREVGAKHHLRHVDQIQEGKQCARVRCLRCVVVKTAQGGQHLVAGQDLAKVGIELWQHDESLDQERHGATRMREDELDVFAARGRAAEQQAGDGARGVCGEFNR